MSAGPRTTHRLMPSEVARLILGYLREQKCEKAASNFLHESKHLHEYRLGLEEGYEYPTTIGGKTLVQFFQEEPTSQSMPQPSNTAASTDVNQQSVNVTSSSAKSKSSTVDLSQQQAPLGANDFINQILDEIMETDQFNNLVTGISSKVADQFSQTDMLNNTLTPSINSFSFSDAGESSPFVDSPVPGTPSSSLGHVSESDEARSIVSSTGSLETPKSIYNTPRFRGSASKYSPKGKFSSLVVKNLFDELRTPEKKPKGGTSSCPGVELVSTIVSTCNTVNVTEVAKATETPVTSSSSDFINVTTNVTPSLQQLQPQQPTANQAAIQVMTTPASVEPCINPIVLTINPGTIVPNFLQLGSATILPQVTPMAQVSSIAPASHFVRIAPKSENTTAHKKQANSNSANLLKVQIEDPKSPAKGKRMSFESFKQAVKKAKTTGKDSANATNSAATTVSSVITAVMTTTASSLSGANTAQVTSSAKSSSQVTKVSSSAPGVTKSTSKQASGNDATGRTCKTIVVTAPSSKFKHFKNIFMDKLSDDQKIDDFLKSKVHRVTSNMKTVSESNDINTKK